MAKETREDRIVRGMIPQLVEHLIELKHLANHPSKESDVEAWCQTLMKSVLGFSASNGYAVRNQETKGKFRFDLIVSKADQPDQILLVAEIKKLGAKLDRSDLRSGKSQLAEYLKQVGDVRWGILTNGYEWFLYDFKSDLISVKEMDIRNDQQEIDASNRGATEVAWNLLDFSSSYYERNVWEELSAEAQALSPASLAKSVLHIDIVKKIARQLNEEHDYRVSVDSLTSKLSDLLEKGLNEVVISWNELQRAELDRYIRNQKRAAKRTQRKSQSDATDIGATDAPESQETDTGVVDVGNSSDVKKTA